MIPELVIGDFAAYFRAVHGHAPFPWQEDLAHQVAEQGHWPGVLDLPTGFGKTAALDIAIFHLALEAARGSERRAPVRIALVVDRRLVVDDAFERAKRIAERLSMAETGTVISRVAERLRTLAGKGDPPLVARRLRGGIPREDDWARTPSQPTILCSTVGQVGSRLLFRGYGISDSMKPIHAGLIGSDCLILLDEAHLSEPFRQTLGWIEGYKSRRWREDEHAAPWGVALLTATPGSGSVLSFVPSERDFADPVLRRRWETPKPARLLELSTKAKRKRGGPDQAEAPEDTDRDRSAENLRVNELLKRALEAHAELKSGGLPSAPAIAVVVNRVARARTVFEELKRRLHSARDGKVDTILMIGPARPVDRDDLTGKLEPIRTGSKRRPEKPLMIVATQCIEAGVDIDLDGLVTEAAPLDALRQRFGRLNRAGREFSPYAAIVCHPKKDAEDPVYGNAITEAWSLLAKKSHKASAKTSDPIVDFGSKAFAETVPSPLPNATLAPKLDAPILLPAHLDLLTQTSPVPNADPEVSLYLHGPNRTVDAVTVVWREDVDPEISLEPEVRRLLVLVPPRSAEALELPVWAVRRWLTAPKASFPELSDIPGDVPDESGGDKGKRVFLWAGDDERSRWVAPKEIRSGSTIVVPTHYGGVDRYGWNPQFTEPAVDVADTAAQAYAGRRFAVRVSPQLFDNQVTRDKLAAAIANADPRDWRDVRDAVIDVVTAEAGRLRNYLSGAASTSTFARVRRLEAVGAALADLEAANAGKGRKTRVDVYADVYGQDEDQRSRGVVFIAPLGITATFQTDETEELSFQISTEDDVAGSVAGYAQLLREHSEAVKAVVERFALSAGLPENRVADLSVAAYLHDSGKSDARFQSWLAHGDPLGPGPDKVLAKSGRQLPPQARTQSGLPEHWRHEALSVRLAPLTGRFQTDVKDQELVLWLIGTHHGHGRPFFPHRDPLDEEIRTNLPSVLGIPATLPLGPGPQSFAYDWNGMDWAALYERLKARYGVWELARMEAVLRLGDHRASEQTLVEGIIR